MSGGGVRWTPEQLKEYELRKNRAGVDVAAEKRKRPKYGNRKVRLESGEVVDSKKEAQRRHELALMQRAGLIRELRHQVKYAFVHEGVLIGTYTADHVYHHIEEGRLVVEDTKSPATRAEPAYRLRVKMMLAFHKINVAEV